MFDFVAIDIETANQHKDICQIGAALFVDGQVVDQLDTLVNPRAGFSHVCTNVHGITAADVADAPLWSAVLPRLLPWLRHYPVVAHSAGFDRAAIDHMCYKYQLALPKMTWYNTLDLYQVNYPDLPSYRLEDLAARFSIPLNHHNAFSDAIVCGQLFCHLCADASTAVYAMQPSGDSDAFGDDAANADVSAPVAQEEEPVMPDVVFDDVPIELDGASLVMTGDSPEMSRSQLTELCQARGARVVTAVSKKTSYLFVGPVDPTLVADATGHKSSKLLKAEALRAEFGKPSILPLQKLVDFFK